MHSFMTAILNSVREESVPLSDPPRKSFFLEGLIFSGIGSKGRWDLAGDRFLFALFGEGRILGI